MCGVRVYTVYHACPSLEIAKVIVRCGFESQHYQDKWFGAGYYFSFHLDYCCENYAKRDAADDELLTIIMARVVVSNAFPVIERSDSKWSLSAKPAVPKHDAHFVLVERGATAPQPVKNGPEWSELVMFDPSKILPIAILSIGDI